MNQASRDGLEAVVSLLSGKFHKRPWVTYGAGAFNIVNSIPVPMRSAHR